MSAKRQPLNRFDPVSYSDMGGWSWDTACIKTCDDGEYVLYDDYKAARAKDAELIQQLVDALWMAPGIRCPHEGVCSDPSCGCIEIKRCMAARALIEAAAAAGFTPTEQ